MAIIKAVAPPEDVGFVICINTIDKETTKGATTQIKSGNNL